MGGALGGGEVVELVEEDGYAQIEQVVNALEVDAEDSFDRFEASAERVDVNKQGTTRGNDR